MAYSAGYWWGRAGECVMRLAPYLLGLEHALWSLLYSDDGWLIGRGEHYEIDLLLFIFVLVFVLVSCIFAFVLA